MGYGPQCGFGGCQRRMPPNVGRWFVHLFFDHGFSVAETWERIPLRPGKGRATRGKRNVQR